MLSLLRLNCCFFGGEGLGKEGGGRSRLKETICSGKKNTWTEWKTKGDNGGMADGDNGDTSRKTAVPTADCWTREAKCCVVGSSDNNKEVVQTAVRRGEESVKGILIQYKYLLPYFILNKLVSSSEEMSMVYWEMSLSNLLLLMMIAVITREEQGLKPYWGRDPVASGGRSAFCELHVCFIKPRCGRYFTSRSWPAIIPLL